MEYVCKIFNKNQILEIPFWNINFKLMQSTYMELLDILNS